MKHFFTLFVHEHYVLGLHQYMGTHRPQHTAALHLSAKRTWRQLAVIIDRVHCSPSLSLSNCLRQING